METLKKYLKCRPKAKGEDFLFLSRTGKSIGRENIWRMIQRFVKAAGIKKPVSPHTFRHSIATHLVENGADIVMVQRLLGHTNILSTQIYLHLGLEKFRKKFYKYHTRWLLKSLLSENNLLGKRTHICHQNTKCNALYLNNLYLRHGLFSKKEGTIILLMLQWVKRCFLTKG